MNNYFHICKFIFILLQIFWSLLFGEFFLTRQRCHKIGFYPSRSHGAHACLYDTYLATAIWVPWKCWHGVHCPKTPKSPFWNQFLKIINHKMAVVPTTLQRNMANTNPICLVLSFWGCDYMDETKFVWGSPRVHYIGPKRDCWGPVYIYSAQWVWQIMGPKLLKTLGPNKNGGASVRGNSHLCNQEMIV